MSIPTELLETITRACARGDGTPICTEAVRVWHTLFRHFIPLLGPSSTQLLFTRSLAGQAAAFPWLPQAAPAAAPLAFDTFARCLDGRAPEEIVAVNRALLSSYTTLLAELIGTRLTVHFLRAAFPDRESGEQTEA